jgi:hypothetical protein
MTAVKKGTFRSPLEAVVMAPRTRTKCPIARCRAVALQAHCLGGETDTVSLNRRHLLEGEVFQR